MSERDTYTVKIAGLTRNLPLFEVAPGVKIAIFNMLGDTYVVKAAAAALAERIREVRADTLLTVEAKSMPLVYEMSALMGLPYVVLRKTYKSYMGEALQAHTHSITTNKKQTLYLDEKDIALLAGKRVLVVDDVVSTGSTLAGMRKIVDEAEGEVAAVAAVFTEGDQDWSEVIALGNLPVFNENEQA